MKAMVVAVARCLNARAAEACGVDAQDQWKFYGDLYIEDAKAALEAADVPGLLAVAKHAQEWTDPESVLGVRLAEVIAKATGEKA